MSQKHKGLKIAVIILLIIFIGLASLFTAGILTDWFGFYGPGGKIMTASGLAVASGNFTLQIDASVGSFDTDTLLVKVDADIDRHEVTIAAMSKNGTISWAIYDSHLIWRSGLRYQAEDISPQLDKLWDAVETGKTLDWAQSIRDIDEDLAQKLEGVIDYDEINGSLIRLYQRSNDSGWLEKHAGLQVRKKFGSTQYGIEPNTYELLRESIACFQDVFLDPQDYQQIQDALTDLQPQLDALNYQMDITTRWGILSRCDLTTKVEDKDIALHIQILHRDQTQLPEQELSDLLSGLIDQ